MKIKHVDDDDPEIIDADARFILANERTLLAWIRTALTILAGAVAFLHFNEKTLQVVVIGLIIVMLGAFTAIASLARFKKANDDIRAGRLPDTGKGPFLQVALVVVFALAIFLVEALQFNL